MSTLLQKLAATGKWLHREFIAAWPVFLFFLVGFLLQLLVIKLAVAQFSIPLAALSTAAVGALLAAKAVLILDQTPLARKLEHYRRIVAVKAGWDFIARPSLIATYAPGPRDFKTAAFNHSATPPSLIY